MQPRADLHLLRRWQHRLDAAHTPAAQWDLLTRLLGPEGADVPATARQTWADVLEHSLAPWVAASAHLAAHHRTAGDASAPPPLWPPAIQGLWEDTIGFPGRPDGQMPEGGADLMTNAERAALAADPGRYDEDDDRAALDPTTTFTVLRYHGRSSGLPLLMIWPDAQVARRADGVGPLYAYRTEAGKAELVAGAASLLADVRRRLQTVGDGPLLAPWLDDARVRAALADVSAIVQGTWRPPVTWGLDAEAQELVVAYVETVVSADDPQEVRASQRQAAAWVADLPPAARDWVGQLEAREIHRLLVSAQVGRFQEVRRERRQLGIAVADTDAWLALNATEDLEDVELVVDALQTHEPTAALADDFLNEIRERQGAQATLRAFLDTL